MEGESPTSEEICDMLLKHFTENYLTANTERYPVVLERNKKLDISVFLPGIEMNHMSHT